MEATKSVNQDLDWKAPTEPQVKAYPDTEQISPEDAPTTLEELIGLYNINPESALLHITYKDINAVAKTGRDQLAQEMLARYSTSRSQA